MTRLGSAASRILTGAALAWCVGVAVAAPEVPRLTSLAAVVILAVTAWRPRYGLLGAAALTPAGLVLAPGPAGGPDLIAWAFLAGWLLPVWRPLAEAGWPRPLVFPALLYGAWAAASWVSVTVGGAAGVDPSAIGLHLAHAISPQFLVFSTPETETWTAVQAVTGIAMLLAAAAIARADAALPRRIAWAIVASLGVLAVLTALDVWRQWSAAGYDVDFLLRYTRGERFALHLADVNAAGSQYVLAAGIAIGMAGWGWERRAWTVPLLLMLPAFWLTGSRSAFVGMIGAAALLAAVRRRAEWRITRAQVIAAGSAVALIVIAVVAIAMFGGQERGSAGRALRLRTQFLETSVRMIGSAPVFGVGVGRYFSRSPEFMPAALRELYGAENAHNYFAQQMAELGIVGGALFVWLVIAAAVAGWRNARAPDAAPVAAPLFAGCAGYLLTCVTGHPFLVSAAALPFWIALGALVANAPAALAAGRRRLVVALTAAVVVLLVVNVGRGVAAWRNADAMPAEYGFDRGGVADDGRVFRWTSPHAVTYVPNGPGFLQVTMRAPDVNFRRPVTVEIALAGRVVERRPLPRGEWVAWQIPVRTPSAAPYRRVDLRVRPTWTEKRPFGRRSAQVDVALGVMVAELDWARAGR